MIVFSMKKSLSDYKVSDLSSETLELMNYYGVDAAHLLNEYALGLEEALEEANEKISVLQAEIADLRLIE